jgi:putative transposase
MGVVEQMRYRRADAAGGTYFFTVNLAERRSDVLVRHIDESRAAMKTVKDVHPFAILAMVVLPALSPSWGNTCT